MYAVVVSLNAWSAILFCFAGLAGSAIGQQNLDSLRHVSNSSTLTFMERCGTCIDGPISKLSATTITVQPNGKSPITIKRTNLLQISQGDALLFTATNKWSNVEEAAAHVYPREAFALKLKNGKVVTGTPMVQISGGEPTLHPEFFRILEMCQKRPIRHLMVNTNGILIAQDAAFAKRLADFMPQFEIYLQFDSLRRDPLMQLRGADLRSVRQKALERLNDLGISTTLVVTVERGVNDGELGAIIDFALEQPAVRGVTIQPVQQAGRLRGFQSAEHRLTLTEVRRRILEQTSVFRPEDLIPVPCHPDALAMAYALKLDSKNVPLTAMVPPEILIEGARNTIVYEQEAGLREHLFRLFATNHSPASQASTLRELLCCLPKALIPKNLGYKNLFRVLIVQFIDAEAFDVRSVKKSCIHIAHPDGKRLIPFDTFNMFYRGELEETRLAPLRRVQAEVC